MYSDLHVADETIKEFEPISFSSGQVATPLEKGSEKPNEMVSVENNDVLSTEGRCSGPVSVVYLTITPECFADEPDRFDEIFPHVVPCQGTATQALCEKNRSEECLLLKWEETARSELVQSHT